MHWWASEGADGEITMARAAISTIVLLAFSTQVTAQFASAGAGSVFTGFNNETFVVNGKPGQSYTVLSDGSLTVNMELVSAGTGHLGPQGEQGMLDLLLFFPEERVRSQVSSSQNAHAPALLQPSDIRVHQASMYTSIPVPLNCHALGCNLQIASPW